MVHLSRLLLLSGLLYLGSAVEYNINDKCGFWTATKLLVQCRSAFYNVLSMEVPKTVQQFSEKKKAEYRQFCETTSCYNNFECEEIKRWKRDIDESCEFVSYWDSDTTLCLKSFFRKAYWAQSSEENSCLREYSFSDNDVNKRREAFTNGKLCFIKYVRDHCTSTILDYFNYDNYNRFIESLVSPFKTCESAKKYLDGLRCNHLMNEYNNRVNILDGQQSNVTFVTEFRKICRDYEGCRLCGSGFESITRNCEILETQYPRST
uniref:DUF19 domain-containing protein n=1 Tax=Caenorhabditis tropicalis TaxID=1561998 RepID=A0A1I7UW42_9PELO